MNTAQGAAMALSTCLPNGTSGVAVSAATAPEIRTDLPSGRNSPLKPAHQVDCRADGREVQPVDRPDIAPQDLEEMQRGDEGQR